MPQQFARSARPSAAVDRATEVVLPVVRDEDSYLGDRQSAESAGIILAKTGVVGGDNGFVSGLGNLYCMLGIGMGASSIGVVPMRSPGISNIPVIPAPDRTV